VLSHVAVVENLEASLAASQDKLIALLERQALVMEKQLEITEVEKETLVEVRKTLEALPALLQGAVQKSKGGWAVSYSAFVVVSRLHS
jgi:hypothetical protein